MQEQYDRKKAELEQKLLREKAELAKVNIIFLIFKKLDTFSFCFIPLLLKKSLLHSPLSSRCFRKDSPKET